VHIVSYRAAGTAERWRAGVLIGPYVVDTEKLGAAGTVRGLLDQGKQELRRVLDEAASTTDGAVSLDDVEIGPPVPDPEKILCLGLNYAEHAAEANLEVPQAPALFAKYANALVGPRAAVRVPPVTTKVDYEGELAVIVGTTCRAVSEADALDCVVGYSVMNDVSARDLQMQTSQWTAGKALDTFAPMGPGIALADDVGDPQDLMIVTRVNGEVVQEDSTAKMVRSVRSIVAGLSTLMTLRPGDIIATGTPAGVGSKRTPPRFLRDGDVVEVEIERIGAIANTIVADD
jgi:2-keto-4-pentenoate hydratase/2-oxohepta-3-ene-1,7-dioic acid hydratase in catechol pathway